MFLNIGTQKGAKKIIFKLPKGVSGLARFRKMREENVSLIEKLVNGFSEEKYHEEITELTEKVLKNIVTEEFADVDLVDTLENFAEPNHTYELYNIINDLDKPDDVLKKEKEMQSIPLTEQLGLIGKIQDFDKDILSKVDLAKKNQ